jgi:hypothetical protein
MRGTQESRANIRRAASALVLVVVAVGAGHTQTAAPQAIALSRAEYVDRVQAVWTAQIVAALMTFPQEHRVASAVRLDRFPKPYTFAPVDDDWYYEMVAVRAFEKYGTGLTVAQLGEQWNENSCGSWGSSEQARLALARGVKAPDCGHPRYNKLWFTIGPQFSADVYGALAPGMPNLAGRLARDFGHVNGYAEAVDGAVFMAGMVSLAFAENDVRTIVRKAAQLIHPSSPYRKCLDLVISLAAARSSFEEIVGAVEDRWHIEYPATNNAVANGGIVAASLWFGGGDFLETVNLAARAADFTDADCNAANAAAVVGAMHGMKCLPAELVAQLRDRIKGEVLGPVRLTPAVDENISDLSKRTAAIGEKLLVANGARLDGDRLVIRPRAPETQPAELFALADLTRYWSPEWKLERAGFGGAGGGMAGIRGVTHLDGDVLATYPRDEVRAVVLRRTVKLGAKPSLTLAVGADAGRAWQLEVYVNNSLVEKRVVAGAASGRSWEDVKLDLGPWAGREVTLRLYQRVLLDNRTAGNAYWKAPQLH